MAKARSAINHEVNNHVVASRPASFFRTAIVAARAVPSGRHLLFNDRLTFQRSDRSRDERRLPDIDTLMGTLDGVFGIDAPDGPRLAVVFERLTATQG